MGDGGRTEISRSRAAVAIHKARSREVVAMLDGCVINMFGQSGSADGLANTAVDVSSLDDNRVLIHTVWRPAAVIEVDDAIITDFVVFQSRNDSQTGRRGEG